MGDGEGSKVRSARELVTSLVRCVLDRDLPTYASAVAFQVLFALVPLVLAGVALLGFLGLEDVWTDRLSEEVEGNMSDDAFGVVDQTVRSVLTERRGLWLTFGLAFAIWQVSSAVRAASGALNLIHGVEEERSAVPRFGVSVAVSVAVLPLLVIGVTLFAFGGRIVSALDLETTGQIGLTVARIGLGIPLLLAVVWLVLRFAPADGGRPRFVSMGAGVIVGGWLVASLAYGFYVTTFASYGDLFGSLATVIVVMTYVYILAMVFLVGAQLDALLRERIEEEGGEAAAGA